jgi:hypothetical protein
MLKNLRPILILVMDARGTQPPLTQAMVPAAIMNQVSGQSALPGTRGRAANHPGIRAEREDVSQGVAEQRQTG